MTRIFWFGLGITAGVLASRRVTARARRMTPAGAAENISDAMWELANAVGAFGADVRAGMLEREAQLHATVARRSGINTAALCMDTAGMDTAGMDTAASGGDSGASRARAARVRA